MLKELRPAFALLVIMTVITGLAYPLGVTGLAKVLFPWRASGSLIEKNGTVIGSDLIGQAFTQARYFHGRPSATTAPDPADATKTVSAPYNAQNSGASNLAPSAKALADKVGDAVKAVRAENPGEKGPVPSDLVTNSASGLDPDISPQAANFQAKRIAAARRAPLSDIRALIASQTEARPLATLGEDRVNVLKLNMALDERYPVK